jgi:hypothetical protein
VGGKGGGGGRGEKKRMRPHSSLAEKMKQDIFSLFWFSLKLRSPSNTTA